jgi:folate-binding protein YgfZ
VGYAVELHKRTLERGLLSLIGPAARRVAAAATRPARDLEANGGSAPTAAALALAPDEYANVAAQIAGAPVLLISTDVGVDVLCAAQATAEVGAALVRAGARSVQEAAAETLRVEHGRPRYGIDLNEGTIPQEAGLNERAVSFTKGCYVGQETVARLFYRGKPNRHLRGLLLGAPAATGAELRQGERTVGQLGSSLVSPRLGPIALALVRREVRVDAELSLPETSARVTELPFG